MMKLNDFFRFAAIAALAILVLCPDVQALVVVDGESNTDAPFSDPGWDHIGTVNNGSGIYLGNQWVLTAAHVALAEPFIIDGQSYSYSAGPTITNPDGSQADLRLLHLHQDPGLPLMTLSKTEVTTSTPVIMISEGFIAGDPFKVSSYTGYEWSDIRQKLWGENNITAIPETPYELFGRSTQYFSTSFNKGPFVPDHEAQAANHDSGGGVFIENEQGQYELAGMIIAVTVGLSEKATFNYDDTYFANLVEYRHEIMAATHIAGDANRDNTVGLLDLDILGRTFGQTTGMVWEDGDFNGDGQVGLLDLDILGANFGQAAMSLNNPDTPLTAITPVDNAVPEPGALSLVFLTGVMAFTRRR